MSKTLEFCFDFISPFSYVAWHALPHYLEQTDADLKITPVFLGAIMQTTGNRPPGLVPAKGAYMADDLQRCCKRYGISFRMHPKFPMMNTRPLLRAVIGLGDQPDEQKKLMDAVFHAMWAAPTPLDTEDQAQVEALCVGAGVDWSQVKAAMEDETTKDQLRTNTDETIRRGAFGAPSFFVGETLFFGHDRLDYAVEALNEAGK